MSVRGIPLSQPPRMYMSKAYDIGSDKPDDAGCKTRRRLCAFVEECGNPEEFCRCCWYPVFCGCCAAFDMFKQKDADDTDGEERICADRLERVWFCCTWLIFPPISYFSFGRNQYVRQELMERDERYVCMCCEHMWCYPCVFGSHWAIYRSENRSMKMYSIKSRKPSRKKK